MVVSKVEDCQLSFGDVLLLQVWANDYTEEWKTLSVEIHLLRVVGHEVLYRRVHLKYRMAVVPS